MGLAARAVQLWLVIAFIGAVLATFRKPIDSLGYDLSLVLALLMGAALPHIAAARVADFRRFGQSRRRSPLAYVASLYGQIVLGGALVLFVPLGVFLVRGTWVPHCDLSQGLLWYLLLPGITLLYAAAIGLFFSLSTVRVWTGTTTSYVFIVATIAVAVRHFIAEPPVFLFNGVFGYIPGPIYDEMITITAPVFWARIGTLAWTALFLSLAATMLDVRRLRLDPLQVLEFDYSFENLFPRTGILFAALTILILHGARQELGTSPDATFIQKSLGGRVESDHFVIYYDRNVTPDDEVDRLVEDHEFRLAEILHTLGWTDLPDDEKLASYVYPNADVKKALMGARGTSFADPFNRAMHLNRAAFPHPVLKHEMVHVVTADAAGILGFNPRIGIHEGLAVAVDWEQERLTPDQWAAVMKATNLLPDVGAMTSSLRFWSQPASRAYLAAGSFVRYLMDTYGPDTFIAYFGDNRAETHFGRPIAELADAWRAGLDTVFVSSADSALAMARLERGAIFDRTCPRQAAETADMAWTAYRAGEHRAAMAGFDRLLEWAPDDPTPRLGKLYAYLGMADTADARTLGRSLVRDRHATARLVDSAHDVLGNLAWNADSLSEATLHFMAIVNEGATESLIRAAYAKLAVLESAAYRRVLTGDAGDVESVSLLTELAKLGPEVGLANYLLGGRLVSEESWRAGSHHLRLAAQTMLPHDAIRAECLQLLGSSRYQLDDFIGAEAAFLDIVRLDRNAAEVTGAWSWVDRCRWRRGIPVSDVRALDVALKDDPDEVVPGD